MIQDPGPGQCVLPLFVKPGSGLRVPAPGLDGVRHFSVDRVIEEAGRATDAGIREFLVFGLPEGRRDPLGGMASDPQSPTHHALRELSAVFPECRFWGHAALSHATDHGLNCCLDPDGRPDHEKTAERFCDICASLAAAGAGAVLPFFLRQGAVASIRRRLAAENLSKTAVFSYGAKFDSSLYGPFNSSTGIAGQTGVSGHINPMDTEGALKKCESDEREGSSALVIKPALTYLDVIAAARIRTSLPLAAYVVSGEYLMLRRAAGAGDIERKRAMLETHRSLFRAGADMVITYDAIELAGLLNG